MIGTTRNLVARARQQLSPPIIVTEIFERTKLVTFGLEELSALDISAETRVFLTEIGMPPSRCADMHFSPGCAKPIEFFVANEAEIPPVLEGSAVIGTIRHASMLLGYDGSLILSHVSRNKKRIQYHGYISRSLDAFAAQIAIKVDLRKYSRPSGAYNEFFESKPYTGEFVGTSPEVIEAVFQSELCTIDPRATKTEYSYWRSVIESLRSVKFAI